MRGWLSGVALCALAASLGSEACAQAAGEQVDEVVVTGTRRTDRTVVQSAAPIDVISSETFRTLGTTDTNNILKNLVPSFNIQRYGIADGSTYVRPPTMRGLPPDEILVLVNGKRFHRAAVVQLNGGPLAAGSQGVDLALIPTSAINRLEVLRDGASAQYGSDAIAGVMNFTLNRNSSGVRMMARYGQFQKGDGKDYQATVNIGLPLGPNGFFNVSGEFVDSAETNRGVQSPPVLAIFRVRPDLRSVIPNPDRISGNPTERSYKLFVNSGIKLDNGAEVYLFGDFVKTKKTSVFNYRVPIGAPNPDFIAGTNCNVTSNGPATCSQAAYLNSALRSASFGAAGLFNSLVYLDKTGTFDAQGRPIWNAAGRTYSFLSTFPGGFTPRFRGDITDASIVGGYKGSFRGISYDFSGSFGTNKIDYSLTNSVNASMGPDSPTEFMLGSLEQREINFNADFTYSWSVAGLAAPVLLSAGAEYRREQYIIGAGDFASYGVGQYGAQVLSNGTTVTRQPGAQGFTGFGPSVVSNRSRASQAVYVGAEGDITERLELGLMGRFEHYADFGNTTTGKVSARYEINDTLALRGTASTGFRAPTPGQRGTYSVGTNFSDPRNPLVPVQTGTYAIDSAAARYFGAKDLKPEKALNFSGGFVLQPFARTTLTVDYYRVRVRDRVSLSPTYNVSSTAITGVRSLLPAGCAATNDKQALACLGDPNADFLFGVNYFSNSFATRTQGVDVVFQNTLTTGFGRWNTTVAANWNKTKVIKRDPSDVNGGRALAIELTNPKFKFNVLETWQIGKFSTTARLSWYGKFHSVPGSGSTPINNSTVVPDNPSANPYNPILTYPSEYTLDLDVSYQVTPQVQVSVGAENILNRYPARQKLNMFPATGSTTFGAFYPGETTISTNGAFWYGRVTAQF
jgi:iron complex outermembrane receptor protein